MYAWAALYPRRWPGVPFRGAHRRGTGHRPRANPAHAAQPRGPGSHPAHQRCHRKGHVEKPRRPFSSATWRVLLTRSEMVPRPAPLPAIHRAAGPRKQNPRAAPAGGGVEAGKTMSKAGRSPPWNLESFDRGYFGGLPGGVLPSASRPGLRERESHSQDDVSFIALRAL